MDTLHIRLLGPPEIYWRGEPWKIDRRLLRVLLFYLAVEGAANRDALRQLFWPGEEDERKARANLRVTLARLRAALPAAEILEVSSQQVSLNYEQVLIDAQQFSELSVQPLRTGTHLSASSPLPERLARQLRRAAELWRSPRFLEGIRLSEDNPELDHWLLTTRQHFEETYQRVLAGLADHAALTGDLDMAIHWAQIALEIDPWSGDLQEKNLRWLLSLGRFKPAASVARSLQERYDQEGETVPARLADLVRLACGAGRMNNHEAEDWPVELHFQVPLVGRVNELKILEDAYRRGGIALLYGEAGSGKTRLVYEFFRRLQPRPRLLLLHAVQSSAALPFQVLIDALRRDIPSSEWERLPAAWRQSMAHLLPELIPGMPQMSQPESPPSAALRGRVFEALRGLLVDLSAKERLLVVLDSSQWCDADTLAVLAYLMERRLFTERCLLVITTRIEEPLPDLKSLLTAQRGSAWFSQIVLPGFTLEETTSLAGQMLQRAPGETLVRLLREQTGGNPLFLLETLHAILEYPAANPEDAGLSRLPVGGSLHGLIRARLSVLRPATRRVAAAAAVLGGEFTPAQIEGLTQTGAEAVAEALDELEKAHLIQRAPEAVKAAFRFIHGQAREVLQWEEGAASLRLLHLRAAKALEAQSEGADGLHGLLAQHYEAAGELKEAVECWVKAGTHARSLISTQAAEVAFRSAGRLAVRIQAGLPEDVLYQLYTQWGEIAAERGEITRMAEIYERLLRAGEERLSPLLVGAALSGQAEVRERQGEAAEALDLYRRASVQLEQAEDPTALVQCYNRQGLCLIFLVRHPEAIQIFEKALALAPGGAVTTRLLEARATTEYYLGIAHILTGWPLRAQAIAAGSLRQDKSTVQVYGHLVMAAAKYYQGEHLASLEHNRIGIQIAHNLLSPRITGYFTVYQVRAELALGQLDAALEHLEHGMEIARAHAYRDFIGVYQCVAGDIYRTLGEIPMAVDAYQAGILSGAGKWDKLGCQYHLALALADAGNLQEGLYLAEDAYRQAKESDLDIVASPALTTWIYLLARAGRLEDAFQRLEEWNSQFQERRFGQAEHVAGWLLCLAARQRGDLAEEQLQARLMIERVRKTGNPWWELYGYRRLKELGRLDGQSKMRIRELMIEIERNVRHPKLRKLAQAFLESRKTELLSV